MPARAATPPGAASRSRGPGDGVPEGATAAASVLVGGWMTMTALRALLGLAIPPGLLQIDVPAGSLRRVL